MSIAYALAVTGTPKGGRVPMLAFAFCFSPAAWAWIAWLIWGA